MPAHGAKDKKKKQKPKIYLERQMKWSSVTVFLLKEISESETETDTVFYLLRWAHTMCDDALAYEWLHAILRQPTEAGLNWLSFLVNPELGIKKEQGT